MMDDALRAAAIAVVKYIDAEGPINEGLELIEKLRGALAAQPTQQVTDGALRERRERAEDWAKKSGFSQGEPMYIRAYMSGYFNHAMARYDGLEVDIIRQFEQVVRALAAQTGASGGRDDV